MQIAAVIKALPLLVTLGELFVEALHWLTGDPETPTDTPTSRSSRKKPDHTKLTQYHYDFIVHARLQWEQYNRDRPYRERKTVSDLVAVINDRMGTDKSQRALARIWTGEIPRDSLPVGTRTFDY